MSVSRIMAFHKTALAYVERGFKVLPVHGITRRKGNFICTCRSPNCHSPGKHPVSSFVPHGSKDATNNPSAMRCWYLNSFGFNIGIATGRTSGIIVLDIDPRHGGDKSLELLEKKHGNLPKTLSWRTGGGGRHFVFKYPADRISVPNSTGRVGAGIDVKSDGGFVVAPPSNHISGGSYSLPNARALNVPLAPIPQWLLQAMRSGGATANTEFHRRSATGQTKDKVPEGQRNITIAQYAGVLLCRNVPQNFCLNLLLAFNEARCVPPLSSEEVARIVASISGRAVAQTINRYKNRGTHEG